MKVKILFIGLLYLLINSNAQEILESPDKKIKIVVNSENEISFSAFLNDKVYIKKANLDLIFNGKAKFSDMKAIPEYDKINEIIEPVISYKNNKIMDECNILVLNFNSKSSIEFRAYNEGFAYRYITHKKKEVEVNELLDITFAGNYNTWASLIPGYQSHYQEDYTQIGISEFPDSQYTYLPVLFSDDKENKLLLTEADHYDYPHMFLQKGDDVNKLIASFPPYPLETELYGDRSSRIIKGAEYIAKTNGDRSFPWRVFYLTDNDARLIESDLVYLLSRDTHEGDASWVKPGRVAWDWFNASNLYGVDFESGLNTNTWKYYIDFAANNGLEYIILDEGWSISTTDLTKPNPETDVQYLIDYGKEKNVGIILWATWRALDTQWEVLDEFKTWGAAGIKVDFMNRADQWMVNFYEKAAIETYKRELLIDYHGAFKPTGLRRSYPNIVSYEGVHGLEESKWSYQNTPESNLTIPFIRMVCGPMDYTPGAMRNFHSKNFRINFYRPSSQGTRAHQVALFVIYESGIQMFADSPSNYEREQETTDFLAKIPNTWDETLVFEARVGKYLVMARRNGEKWFIAGLTDSKARDFTIDLSFLDDKEYHATIMQDGINSDKFAEDYKVINKKLSKNNKLIVKMHQEGGFTAILE